jgi:hypothetical protein
MFPMEYSHIIKAARHTDSEAGTGEKLKELLKPLSRGASMFFWSFKPGITCGAVRLRDNSSKLWAFF